MRKKKMLSVILSLALVFTTVFAGTGSAFAATEAYVPFNYNQVDWNDTNLYLDKVTVFPDALTAETAQQTVTVAKKGHYMFMVTPVATTGGYMTVGVFNPNGEAVTQQQVYLSYDENTGTYMASATLEVGLQQAGTYTVAVIPDAGYTGQMLCELFATYLPQSVKASPMTVLGKGDVYVDNPSDGYSWFKVTTSGVRNLKLQMKEAQGNFQVTLFKSNKSTVLGKKNISIGSSKDYTTYFAVPKGTYYIRVFHKEATAPYYAVKLTQTKVTEKSGTTKAKAVATGKNVLRKGTVLSTQTASAADWYKITLTKDQKFYVHLNLKSGGPSNGGIKMSVYRKGSSKVQLSKKFAAGEDAYDWNLYTIGNGGKLEKGTYYIKVQKYNYGTGFYSLKWNNVSK